MVADFVAIDQFREFGGDQTVAAMRTLRKRGTT
jgi:hypothetical protein